MKINYSPVAPTGPAPTDADVAARLSVLESELRDARTQIDKAHRRVLATWGVAVAGGVFAFAFGHSPQAVAQSFGSTLLTLGNRISALEAKTAPITLVNGVGTNTEMFLSGVNLHVVNGLDQTATTNGLGNLIVGYNETRTGTNAVNDRSGSHNIIVGAAHNFTRFGGLVAGLNNAALGDWSCVTGGFANQATGWSASVTGGYANQATNFATSVTGGQSNRANGPVSSVIAGYFNVADGGGSSVTGGQSNRADGGPASVSGGHNRTALSWGTWRAGTLSATP